MKRWFENTYIQATLLALGFLLIFLALYSRDYMAVDGTTRCLAVSHRNEIFFHGNNHLLFPVNVFLWHKFLAFFGLKASNKLDYIHLTTWMNALAAAGVLAIFYSLIKFVTKSTKYSLAITICYGFSRAFLMHATNASEPMVGLFWSVLAIKILVIALKKDYTKLIFLVGFLFALTMATYQSMVLLSPMTVLLCLQWPTTEDYKKLIYRLGYLFSGSIFGVATIYGYAYYTTGTKNLSSMIARFFAVTGDSVYGSWALSKVLSLPIQFVRSILPIWPGDFAGIIGWFIETFGDNWVYWAYLVYSLLFVLGTLLVFFVWQIRKEITTVEKIAIQAALVGIILPLVAAAYWFPGYDKLWLQPNFCLVFLFGVLVKQASTLTRFNLFLPAVLLFVVLEISSNLFWLIPNHYQKNVALSCAEEVSKIVKSPPDLVIADWDHVSLLYGALWSYHIYSFPSAAEQRGVAVLAEVEKLIEETKQRGGKVYFLGLLDETEYTWSVFIGARGVPYESFDKYRQQSKKLKHFKFSAFESSLRVLEFNDEMTLENNTKNNSQEN